MPNDTRHTMQREPGNPVTVELSRRRGRLVFPAAAAVVI